MRFSTGLAAWASLLFFYSTAQADWIQQTDTIFLPNGTPLRIQMQKPSLQPATQQKLPVVLIFGGFQDAAKILGLFQPPHPAIVATFDYPFEGNRKFAFPKSLGLIGDAKKMILDTLAGIQLLKNTLLERTDTDSHRMTLVGASLGAPFALIAASHDPDWDGIALIHGFGEAPQVIAHQFNRAWTPRLGAWITPLNALVGHLLWWYTGLPSLEESASRLKAHQHVLVLSAEKDSFVPPSASESLRNALNQSKAQITDHTTSGDHVQPHSVDLIQELVRQTTDWMKKNSLL